MPAPSQPPPADQIPGHSSGGGPYLIGAVVLVAAAVALYFVKRSSAPPITPQTTAITATAPPAEPPPPAFAPPPPPKLDDEPDAGSDAGAPAPKSAGGPVGAAGPGPCGAACTGQATPGLQAALRSRAQSAQGCYQRALRTSEVSGSLTVSVQVGPSGSVCSASLAADSVHSSEVTSCVLGRFRGQAFPPPSGGCVTVNIPISFTIKQ